MFKTDIKVLMLLIFNQASFIMYVTYICYAYMLYIC